MLNLFWALTPGRWRVPLVDLICMISAGGRLIPKASVGAIITSGVDGSQRVFLVRRAYQPFKDYWCLPGGNIKRNEQAIDAIVREVKEETGLDFEPHFWRYFDEIIPDMGIHSIVLVFTGPALGETGLPRDEVTEICRFPLTEARCLKLAFCHGMILDEFAALQGQSSLLARAMSPTKPCPTVVL
ncbi:MAG: NUDIX hydrolase [Chloroflexi bacterium]|nr:NUDIX hydrolase [Chloroflexota bacterium]